MPPVIRKHQSFQQLLAACLRSSSISEKLLNNSMVTQYLSQGPQSKPSKRICPKKVKKLEIMVNYNYRAQLRVKGIPFISFLWTDGDSDSMRQLESSPWPQLLFVPCTNPKRPKCIDARKYFHQHLPWSLIFVGSSCDVLEGSLSKRLVCARTYLSENLASYL